jgi:tetratricopeptide (TPR) repeat protein
MHTHQEQCEAAIMAGAWDTLFAEALAWSRDADGVKDPRPLFARNVVYLVQGRFAEAWKTHALCLEAQQDITIVGAWVKELIERLGDSGYAHLVMGLFLAQSGQSERSMGPYAEAARLLPQSVYPHYFLAQIHERAGHLEMAIKEYREAVRLAPDYAPARMNLGVAYQDHAERFSRTFESWLCPG